MNKNKFLLFVIFGFSPLSAMEEVDPDMPRISSDESIHADMPDIDEIPLLWKQTNFKELGDELHGENYGKKARFYFTQLVRYHDCWQHINDLQERFPEKIQITLNHAFAVKHKNAFLFYPHGVSNHSDVNELVERIKRVKASLAEKEKTSGESHE